MTNPVATPSSAYRAAPRAPNAQSSAGVLGLTLFEWLCLAVFAALVLLTESRHEPFADEAQSWLIARDSGFWPMISNALRYEGTPGLWPALLWIPAHAGLPYSTAGYIACAFGIASAWFLMRFAPFPLAFRIALPFTYWLCYQYTVIARSYAITVFTVFAAARLFRIRPSKIIPFALALAAMANANAPGLALAGGFAAAYAWLLWREGKPDRSKLPPLPRALAAAAIFAGAAAIAVWISRPAPDQNFSTTRLVSILARLHVVPRPQPMNDLVAPAPPMTLRQVVSREEREFANPVSSIPVLSYALMGIVIWQLWRRRMIILVLPLASLSFFMLVVFAAEWHRGLIVITLIALLWISWPDSAGYRPFHSRSALLPVIPLAFICLIQIPWTIHAIGFDWKHRYSGAAECAKYLKTEAAGTKVFAYGYWSVGVAPYFEGIRFANFPDHAYWWWSRRNRINFDLSRIDLEHPQVILVSGSVDTNTGKELLLGYPSEILKLVEAHGYEPVTSFSGTMIMRDGFRERDSYYILKPVQRSASSRNGGSVIR